MEVQFYSGWPFRYPRVIVKGLKIEHALGGLICLWADDDPAQVAAVEIEVLWRRLDEWAAAAQRGFSTQDEALDAYIYFEEQSGRQAELPFGDFVRKGTNGYRGALIASIPASNVLMIEPATDEPLETTGAVPLQGAFYLKGRIGAPPRNLEDIRAALTRKQLRDLESGLKRRAAVGMAERSGGYDFVVFAWPRHEQQHDAIVVGFEGAGESLRALAISATPNDIESRRRRAGPDQNNLMSKRVLIAGVGSVGGQVASMLASSGAGTLVLHDSDTLKTGNVVRHVAPEHLVGYRKTDAMWATIKNRAPWTAVEREADLPYTPSELASSIEGFDLVVDCTGNLAMSAALAISSRRTGVPLITGALFHQGKIGRVQRQGDDDHDLQSRPEDAAYLTLPPDDPTVPTSGFLELGCTAPVNNAPPIAVLTLAADIADAAVDQLTGRRVRSDERILVLQPMAAPFDQVGTLDSPRLRQSAR